MNRRNLFCFLTLLLFCGCAAGCHKTYHPEKVAESIKEICLKEYGIQHVEVKLVGNTLGVHLPLRQLFSSDFEHILATGKVQNLESLLQFSPEAMEKVEDVLFSTSRVILSTGRPIDFYVLKAADTEVTGIELILIGLVDDVKRVRFWDISRNEYRDRVFHDLKVNHAVLWHRPVHNLFEDMKKLPVTDILDKYFISGTNLNMVSPFFYSHLMESPFKQDVSFEILDIRSTPFRKNETLVYIKVLENFTPKSGYEKHRFVVPSGYTAEYLFMVVQQGNQFRINRVIPFEYVGEDRVLHKIKFPEELRLYQNIENWQSSFELDEVLITDFLAQQITRRMTGSVFSDERIANTLGKVKPEFVYESSEKNTKGLEKSQEEKENGYFIFRTLPPDKDVVAALEAMPPIQVEPEDVEYYLDKMLQLAAKVLRNYQFKHFTGIEVLVPYHKESVFLKPDDLEQIRKKKFNFEPLVLEGKIL
ncbi:MAG: hypothetical protein HY586_05925 [Candidatus Omnitrophica bacterium]|nr:hypothetical protein [Candidatus Omnitrophota bacterium]